MLQKQNWIELIVKNWATFVELVHLFSAIFLVHYLFIPLFRREIIIDCQLLSDVFSIRNGGNEYFLSSHQTISGTGLDKLTVHRPTFGPNAMTVMSATMSSLVPQTLA